MNALRAAAACLLALSALAGCMDDTPTTTTTSSPTGAAQRLPLPADPMPEGPTHDHGDPAQHKFLWNYAFSARDPLMSNAANAAGLHALDLQAGHLFGAVYGSHALSVDGGLQIWDVTTDPAQPKALGRWTIPGSVGGDRSVGATQDGEYAVIGLEPVTCFGHVNPVGAATSAYLLDTRDKSRPVVADVVTPAGSAGSPGGSIGSPGELRGVSTHSVFVHRINGTDYAFLFGDIYEIVRGEAGGARLAYIATVSTGHDIYLVDTPWNRTWAISAGGELGLTVTDVTDPSDPQQIATWDHPDHEMFGYYFHTADAAFVGDQTLVILTSEDFGQEGKPAHASPLWVLDGNPLRNITKAADSVQLEELGEWHNPYNHTAENLRFSLHNPRVHDGGILSVSSYHAGLWQLDLRDPEFWAEPAPIAYIAYAEGEPPQVRDPVEDAVSSRLCGLPITVDAPLTMDVEVGANGTLYLADVYMGLYTYLPTADHPVFGGSVAARDA